MRTELHYLQNLLHLMAGRGKGTRQAGLGIMSWNMLLLLLLLIKII